ncbi:hypothetical protein CUT44_28465 [Streptomyces carminius]|uniref:Uncharacterized protein n=1 Tax=Streptomyces carminius TaxID=2665496 RepID=A0A2M8LQH4_9ACTN|nr:hypothetical protein [Streptomyces carminius]PJE94213.1 hypothetical protein CUT44_28465 [Streptomyces carminius]
MTPAPDSRRTRHRRTTRGGGSGAYGLTGGSQPLAPADRVGGGHRGAQPFGGGRGACAGGVGGPAATAADDGGGGPFEVRRYGPAARWERAEAAWYTYEAEGCPEQDEFGLAVTRDGHQEIRLRDPSRVTG